MEASKVIKQYTSDKLIVPTHGAISNVSKHHNRTVGGSKHYVCNDDFKISLRKQMKRSKGNYRIERVTRKYTSYYGAKIIVPAQ